MSEEIYIGIHLCPFCKEEMRRYDFERGWQRAMRYICDVCGAHFPCYYENHEGIYVDYRGERP